MPVWVEGRTVRGYKVEQFADAFARVLGVRGDRAVSSEFSTDTAPNVPIAPNAHMPAGERTAVPLLGDEGYRDLLDAAFQAGHVTEYERKQARLVHLGVVRISHLKDSDIAPRQ
jgi:hypothetical protein